MSIHDPELVKAHAANRAAIDAARDHNPRTCPCEECDFARWDKARMDEDDARWNARMNP